MRIAFDGAEYHRAAVFRRGLRLGAVMHVARRHEQYAIQTLHQARGLRNEQMDVVNGIERPAENSQSHYEYVNSYGPMRTVSPSTAPSSRNFLSTPIFARICSNRARPSSESKFVIAA